MRAQVGFVACLALLALAMFLAVEPRLLYQNDGKGYLEAECVRSGLLKTYRLDRIHKIL